MPIEAVLTYVFAVGLPVWLLVEELLHHWRKRRAVEPPVKRTHPVATTPRAGIAVRGEWKPGASVRQGVGSNADGVNAVRT